MLGETVPTSLAQLSGAMKAGGAAAPAAAAATAAADSTAVAAAPGPRRFPASSAGRLWSEQSLAKLLGAFGP